MNNNTTFQVFFLQIKLTNRIDTPEQFDRNNLSAHHLYSTIEIQKTRLFFENSFVQLTEGSRGI